MKVQDLNQELKPASSPSTPWDGNPSEHFNITLKFSQLLCTSVVSFRTEFCYIWRSVLREKDGGNGYTNNSQTKPEKRATLPLPWSVTAGHLVDA